MTVRKINLMHRMFGINQDRKCGDCDHFVEYNYRTKHLKKCECYGCTRSEASDWAKKWQACGLYNKPYDGTDIIRMVCPKKEPAEPLPNQINLFGEDADG